MMREVLFRGRAYNSDDWHYGSLLVRQNGRMYIHCGTPANKKHGVSPETVGQYTGLKIKGKKLFEHDRIRWRETKHDEWQYGMVVWCGGRDYPAFDVEPWIDCDCNGLSYIMAVCEAEIVGTKWDNPELLEVE